MLPRSLRATRVLMYVVGGIHLLTTAGLYAYYTDHSAEALGELLVFALPGVVSVVLAARLRRGTKLIWWSTIALQVVYVLMSLNRIRVGDPGGLLELGFPVAILILVTRKAARAYCTRQGPAAT